MPDFSNDLKFYAALCTLLTCLVLAALLAYLAARGMFQSKQPARTFPDRPSLSLDEFYETFYSDQGFPRAVVAETVVRFAEACRMPAEQAHPDDALMELAAANPGEAEQFAVETAVLIQDVEARFGVSLFQGRLVTLDDYIRVNVLAQRFTSRRHSAKA